MAAAPGAVAAAAAVAIKEEEPPLPLLKYIGYSFLEPKKVYANLMAGSNKLNIAPLALFLFLVSIFSALPQILHGSTKGFFREFFSSALFFGLFILLGALLSYGAFLLLYKKKISFKLLISILQVVLVPFALYKVLGFLFVLAAGYEAKIDHFSAGLGLFLPIMQSQFLNILLKPVDLFPVLSMLSASAGFALCGELPYRKVLPIAVAVVSVSLCVVSFLP